jgi:hypothetical protein
MFELLGPPDGAVSTIPACAGAQFKLQPSFDPGAPQPRTDYVATMLDGSRPFGTASDNRVLTLPIHIHGTDFSNLAAAVELLKQAVDAEKYPLVWTRRQADSDPQPYPFELDCFRATAAPMTGGGVDGYLVSPVGMVTLTIPALPYGKSQQPVLVPLASPVTGGPDPPPDPVTLDDFGSVTQSGWTKSGSAYIVGPNSAHWSPAAFGVPTGKGIFPSYLSSFSATDLTGLTSLSVFAGFGGSGFYYYYWRGGVVTVAFTLTDSNGAHLSFSVPVNVTSGNSASSPHFTPVTAPIPQGRTGFDYSTVVSCETSATNITPDELAYTDFYLDALTAVPPSQVTAVEDRGHVYIVRGVTGTARTTVSIKAQERFGS